MSIRIGKLLVGTLLLCFLALPARAQEKIGAVQFALGDVKILSASGQERIPKKGDLLFEGDTVVTGALASTQLKMIDDAIFAIRPDSRVKFETYRYAGREDGSERGLMALAQGGFRTITGLIGRLNKQNYGVRTPTATIGIRGTDHEIVHILPAVPGRVPIGQPGSYDKVNVGAAFIRTEVATVNIARNQVGYAPAPNLPPQILPRMPEFFRATPTPIRPAARPAPAEEQKQAAAAAKPAPGEAKPAPSPAPAGPEPIRSEAVVDNPAQISTVATQAVAEAAVTTTPATTTIVSPTTTTTTTTTATTGTTSTAVPILLTNSAGTTVSATTQTATTSSGVTVPIAQALPNPLVASSNYDHRVNYFVPVVGGVEHSMLHSLNLQSNTQYLLDTSRNLAEIKSSEYVRFGLTYTAQPPIASADVKFSGGTAMDHYDDEPTAGGSVYMGRWQGGQVSVTDLATTGAVAPFTDTLSGLSAHWITFLQPGVFSVPTLASISNVQPLIGTTSYSLLASTTPTDASGATGVLNSASLAANFSAQTVNAGVNITFPSVASPNVTLDATASNIPIRRSGFDAFYGSTNAPTISCIGAGCSPSGYAGHISGTFGGTGAGAVGTKAGFGYGMFANTALGPNQPYSEFYQGLALFNAGAAPTAGVNPTPVGSTGQYRTQAIYPVSGAGTSFLADNRSASASLPAKSMVLDPSGNLVHVLGGSWNVFDRGLQTQCLVGAPCLLPTTTPNDSTSIFSMAGGTVGAAGTVYNANGDLAGTGVTESFSNAFGGRIGRYQGGVVNVSSDTGLNNIFTNVLTGLGSNSVTWSMREVPSSIPVSGSARYLPTAATAPVDSFGNIGKLNYAALDANFTAQTVSPSVGISINNQNLAAGTVNVPISSSFGFDVSSSPTVNATLSPVPPSALAVECSGINCAPPPVATTGGGYGARIIGGFSGDATASGAGFRYGFSTRYDPAVAPGSGLTGAAPTGRIANDYINGAVGFGKSALPVAAPGSGSEVRSSFFFWPGGTGLIYGSNDSFQTTSANAAASGIVTDASGNLVSATDFDPSKSNPDFQTLTGTLSPSGLTSTTNGISFGRYDAVHAVGGGAALTMNGQFCCGGSFSGPFGPPSAIPAINLLGAYQWIKGPEAYPFFLAQPLIGSATYTAINTAQSVPTDQNGVTGTLNSAALSVNFDRQYVDASVNATVPAANGSLARTWTATASQIKLSGDSGFNASDSSASNPLAHQNVSVTLSTPGATPSTSGFGSMAGSLTGTGLNGAILAYDFAGFDPNNSFQHEHVNGVVAFSGATQNVMTPYVIYLSASGKSPGFNSVTGALQTSNQAYTFNDEHLTRVAGGAINPARIEYNSLGQPVARDIQLPIVSVNGTCPAQCSVTEIPARVSLNAAGSAASGALPAMPSFSGAATILDFGTDATTGIMWGRYSSGNRAIVDRITGSPIGAGVAAAPDLHFLLTSAQSGPPVLPVSGTFNYTLAGNTNPTDGAFNAGTLNSAALSANFTAQTVDASVNATVTGLTMSGSATSVPIQKNLFFEAAKPLSGTGNLNVSCSGAATCNPSLVAGRIVGGFTGSTGQGAGMAYSLNTGGASGTSISGVAVFKR